MDQPVEFANLAIAGATVMSVREAQLDRAVRAGPDLVSLIAGINDTLRSTWDPGRVRDDVLSCVASLTAAGANVMTARFHDHGQVLGLPGLLSRPLQRRIEVVNEAYAAAHRAYGGLQIDLTAEPLVYDRQFWSVDRLHPGELGHRRLAAEFAIGLRTLGFQVEPPSLEPAGGKLPNTWRDLWWLATAGAPWIGRRARDLTPWAARLAFGEATARLAGRAPAA
jgi:lysophospholipase L1-like esterase